MSFTQITLINLGLVLTLLTLLWLVSVRLRDVSIIDLFWGTGFVVIVWASVLLQDAWTPRSILLTVLTTLWGLRLSIYLAWRNHGKPEDYRYRAMREARGPGFTWQSLFLIFWLQGVIMWVVSLPLQTGVVLEGATRVGLVAWFGVAVWLTGWSFESIGDLQLARFKAQPQNAGQVMDRGLWRYTRHPNYFGDFLVWWGLYLVSFGEGGGAWSIVGPVLMSICLMKFSGVALLEKGLKNSKPGFAEYAARTNAFFPGPVRKKLES